jgi:hypothetical protein
MHLDQLGVYKPSVKSLCRGYWSSFADSTLELLEVPLILDCSMEVRKVFLLETRVVFSCKPQRMQPGELVLFDLLFEVQFLGGQVLA